METFFDVLGRVLLGGVLERFLEIAFFPGFADLAGVALVVAFAVFLDGALDFPLNCFVTFDFFAVVFSGIFIIPVPQGTALACGIERGSAADVP